MKRFVPAVFLAMCTIAICSFYARSVAADPADTPADGRHGQTRLTHANSQALFGPHGPKTSGNGINYHGGPVILNGTHIYYIWYGDWTGATTGSTGDLNAGTILTTFGTNIGGSRYFNINTTYYGALNGTNIPVMNAVNFSGQTGPNFENYRYGRNLSDGQVQSIVSDAISQNWFGSAPDPNGVYFVLTTADVNETSGFCTQYCGWHTYFNLNGVNVKYAFVGNAARCLNACAEQTNSPNNDPGADGMASIIGHELEESTTDPLLNAWYDTRGEENADKCAWTFGTVYRTSNGSYANMQLGGLNFLIQQNWVNASGGYCALSY